MLESPEEAELKNEPGYVPETQESLRPLRVFLCHSSGDKEHVRQLHVALKQDGFAPWLDEADLLPGQVWSDEIRRAVRESHVVVVCLSTGSMTADGYVHKEIKLALDVADEKATGTIFLIPARLEVCTVPERLSAWQWVDLFDARGYERLVSSLQKRKAQLDHGQVPAPRAKISLSLPAAGEKNQEMVTPVAARVQPKLRSLKIQIRDITGIVVALAALSAGIVKLVDSFPQKHPEGPTGATAVANPPGSIPNPTGPTGGQALVKPGPSATDPKTPPPAPRYPVTVSLYDGAEEPKISVDDKIVQPDSYQSGRAQLRLTQGGHRLVADYPNRLCTATFSVPTSEGVSGSCGPK